MKGKENIPGGGEGLGHESALSLGGCCTPRREVVGGGPGPARKPWAWAGLVGMISLERPAVFFPLLCVVLGESWRW